MRKHTLTNWLFIAILLFSSLDGLAQTQLDVVKLKNGKIYKGKIIEQDVSSHIKLELSGGSSLVFKNEEIEKITREELSIVKNLDLFAIKDPVLKSTYQGEQIGNMRWKKLKTTLRSANDPEINKDLSRLQTKRVLNTTFSVIGCTLLGIGAAGILLAPDDPSSLGVMGAGLGFFIAGSISGSGSRAITKKMMIRYNSVISPSMSLKTGKSNHDGNRQFVPGFTLLKKF